jgi:hypothetical protein
MDSRDRDLIIKTLYGEAGNQGPHGMAAVAHVIKNRFESGHWGNSPGAVATASDPKSGVHQFSMWNSSKNMEGNTKAQNLSPDNPNYQAIGALVDGVFGGAVPDPTNGATHYYAPAGMKGGVPPSWAKSGTNVNKVGDQIFMNLPGPADLVEARSRNYPAYNYASTNNRPVPGTSIASVSPDDVPRPTPALAPAITTPKFPGMLTEAAPISPDLTSLLTKRRDLYGLS